MVRASAGRVMSISASPFVRARGGPFRPRESVARQLAVLPIAKLRKRLFDDSPEVRLAAARASALKGDRALAVALIFLLGDAEAGVSQQARAALYSLTGRDAGPDPGADAANRRRSVAIWLSWLRAEAPQFKAPGW